MICEEEFLEHTAKQKNGLFRILKEATGII